MHTRGTWENRPVLNTNAGAFEVVCRGRTLAFVQGNDSAHNAGCKVPFKEALANGRVMAASPMLLKSLQALVAAWESLPPSAQVPEEINVDAIWNDARAAIAEALQ